ncbi:DNA repair protein RAD5B [Senna tora]|uniref:DNA repair protein RAD5B n=1 Tax=Senna tora TaxID=362788 RepID=A0A835CCF5_9FABA|nr:DNA repair protein RAD5B [Senna tora]
METEPFGGDVVHKVRSRVGSQVPEAIIIRALSECGFDPNAAVKFINDNPGFLARPLMVVRTMTSTGGARVSAPIKQEVLDLDDSDIVMKDSQEKAFGKQDSLKQEMGPNGSQPLTNNGRLSFDDFLKATNTKVMTDDEYRNSLIGLESSTQTERGVLESEKLLEKVPVIKQEMSNLDDSDIVMKDSKEEVLGKQDSLKQEMGSNGSQPLTNNGRLSFDDFLTATNTKVMTDDEYRKSLVEIESSTQTEGRVLESEKLVERVPVKKEVDDPDSDCMVLEKYTENRMVVYNGIEDREFAEDPEWLFVGGSVVIALSTTKGRKLVDNEIVHFNFPAPGSKLKSNSQWIVRVSTKRFGEVGRLPMEWSKFVVPLVHSSKVKVQGRCIAAPTILQMMQEIMLYVSFYIHHSIFTECDGNSSWKLDSKTDIDSTIYPLLTLFKWLDINQYQKAEFTPEDLDSRKRKLNMEGGSETALALPMMTRGRSSQQRGEENKDEEAVSESYLNKLVGAAEVYDLEEMEPPSTLMCALRPYQKQALYWMSELEKGNEVEEATKTLHPCWAAYRICDGRASSIYVNNFTGEATTKMPTASQIARGGILADAMGLGKTVMTIALILARPGRVSSENKDGESSSNTSITKKRKKGSHMSPSFKAKGGTLIVCPMALLSQWKDELETHSEPESISVFVHYGGDRTNDPEVIAEYDVVLTTYGLLTAAYKSDGEDSIYHRIDWHRVVLDEAHTIKASRTRTAQSAFALSSRCRWCLTGTPLQNNLEDVFSLLCFLHIEPWCNWQWWNKLIQKPYENGDPRGLKLVKAILRPLMLRRTKETKDKEGRPILVLPPADIQVIECEQSEAEQDFYNALYKRSKVQFDEYVAQNKVLHNYANILELLLRLRQCCNHPFLVMSRSDSQQYADLNKLAKRFSDSNSDSASKQTVPPPAYIEEVVEGIRKGENIECPICMESADDPVFTPCAHRMCRECLLSSWRTPVGGPCPLCRQLLKKTDLITCPSESPFRIDVEKNWKESSKVSKLLECLEGIEKSNSGEKSIVFSQWTTFLDLLEIPLKRKGIGYLRFDGKLAQKQREKVLKEFSQTNEKRILLMSLKAGGVGLNLTAASNVFLMDPWWNPAVEEQAIMRIHRIGQERTVVVRRFIVKETVEERMQQVQAKKQRLIAGALTDEEVRSARLEELKMLFR